MKLYMGGNPFVESRISYREDNSMKIFLSLSCKLVYIFAMLL
jgi:hypothetical protein